MRMLPGHLPATLGMSAAHVPGEGGRGGCPRGELHAMSQHEPLQT